MFQFLDDFNQFSARLPAFDSLHTFDVESAKKTLFCVIDMDMSRSVIPDKPLDSIPTAGDLAELDSIAAVIIGGAAFAGGRGSVGNALVGAFTIGVIRNALNLHNVDAFYQLMAIGVVVLLAVEADVLRGYVEGRVRVLQATRQA